MKLDHETHCEMPFGDCVQTHEEDSPQNSTQECALGVTPHGGPSLASVTFIITAHGQNKSLLAFFHLNFLFIS